MLDYLRAALHNYVLGTLWQRATMRGMPPLQEIGGDVAGLTVIVTGPTSGIGWTTAAELAKRGAHVVLACRSQSKGDAMVAQLKEVAAAEGLPTPSLELALLDLASLDSVRQFVQRWEQQQRPLHALVNNAGMFNMGVGRSETSNGIELHMQTNHLAPFLLSLGLLPSLQRAAAQADCQQPGFRPRIVMVSSDMHHFGYRFGPRDPLSHQAYKAEVAYGNSKLAQILCAIELNRRLAKAGAAVDVVPLHPGNVLTEVVRSLPPLIQRAYRTTLANVLLTPTEGARASVYAATDRGVAQHAGCYLAANAKPGKLLATNPELTPWTWNWSKSMVQLPDDWDLPA